MHLHLLCIHMNPSAMFRPHSFVATVVCKLYKHTSPCQYIIIETRCVNMFSTKTKADVGMVQHVSDGQGKTSRRKTSETRRGSQSMQQGRRASLSNERGPLVHATMSWRASPCNNQGQHSLTWDIIRTQHLSRSSWPLAPNRLKK